MSIWVARSAKHFGSWNPFRSHGSPERSKLCVSADASGKVMVKIQQNIGKLWEKKSCSKYLNCKYETGEFENLEIPKLIREMVPIELFC